MNDELMQFNKPVTHEAFMQRALYDPRDGYYTTRAIVGRSGDFSTSATLSPAFPEAIANWATTTTPYLGLPAPCPLIELGSGDGSLAKALSKLLPKWPLHLVETSEPLRNIQAERLKGTNFQHHTDLKSALAQTDGMGLIIANEFIDAFPAVKLRWQGNDCQEVAIKIDDKQIEEILLPLERDIDADAPAHPREGETIYVHPSFHEWLQSNLPALRQGALLFIDYGAERPAHACRAYAGQERYENHEVYNAPGERDITCDVNFTDLTRWCQRLGLNTNETTTQADFLNTHLDDLETRQKEDETLAFLMHPLGAGGAFKVLCSEKFMVMP